MMKKGQSIVETVIAAALISFAVVAALSLSNYSQKQSRYSNSLAEANKYGYQAADWLRTQKNSLGWAEFTDKISSDAQGNEAFYCLPTIPASPSTFLDVNSAACADTDYITGTTFLREVRPLSSTRR